MADEVWKIREDGYLDLDVECSSIIYHPNLNIFIVLSKTSEVLVIDVNSGLLLQRTILSGWSRWPTLFMYILLILGYDKMHLLINYEYHLYVQGLSII